MFCLSVHFFACPKKRTKEKAPCVPRRVINPHCCPAVGGSPCAPRCCRGFANLASPQTVGVSATMWLRLPKSLFRQPLRCSAACQWDFSSPPHFVLPRLAGEGGKRCGNCLRAKPEFFRVPPSSRSKGSPQGQDWLGCLFLVSSFGHAKEERKTPPDNARAGSILVGL